jgi:hypothetical protein
MIDHRRPNEVAEECRHNLRRYSQGKVERVAGQIIKQLRSNMAGRPACPLYRSGPQQGSKQISLAAMRFTFQRGDATQKVSICCAAWRKLTNTEKFLKTDREAFIS